MHAVRNCGAAASFAIVVSFFKLLLCDVGCFFVTQSHSIKVTRWPALVIFSFFSSPVVLPRSSSKLLVANRHCLLATLACAWAKMFTRFNDDADSMYHTRSPNNSTIVSWWESLSIVAMFVFLELLVGWSLGI